MHVHSASGRFFLASQRKNMFALLVLFVLQSLCCNAISASADPLVFRRANVSRFECTAGDACRASGNIDALLCVPPAPSQDLWRCTDEASHFAHELRDVRIRCEARFIGGEVQKLVPLMQTCVVQFEAHLNWYGVAVDTIFNFMVVFWKIFSFGLAPSLVFRQTFHRQSPNAAVSFYNSSDVPARDISGLFMLACVVLGMILGVLALTMWREHPLSYRKAVGKNEVKGLRVSSKILLKSWPLGCLPPHGDQVASVLQSIVDLVKTSHVAGTKADWGKQTRDAHRPLMGVTEKCTENDVQYRVSFVLRESVAFDAAFVNQLQSFSSTLRWKIESLDAGKTLLEIEFSVPVEKAAEKLHVTSDEPNNNKD